jgi:DNA-binding NarL/FixJ family response regulator
LAFIVKNAGYYFPRMSRNKRSPDSSRRVFIVEDHPVFREGLVHLLETEEDLEVCGEAGDFATALKGIKIHKPDIILIDLELPDKSGLELIKKLRAMKMAVKLLVVSMYDEALYADRVLRAGGDGYVMKEENPHEIIQAIHDVLEGRIYVSEEVMSHQVVASAKSSSESGQGPLHDLTDRELKVLELLGQGKSNIEIARQLLLKAGEIPRHCKQLQKKLKLKSNNALIRYAVCWVETGAV